MRQAMWLRPGKSAAFFVETSWGLAPVRRPAASLAELRRLEAAMGHAMLADLAGMVFTKNYLARRGELVWLPEFCANCGGAWADLNGLCHLCQGLAKGAAA